MKLTFQVPHIILDNTKSEALVELITKASQSLAVSGSVLLSKGDGYYEIYTLSDLTSSLIHAVSASTPLENISSDPLRPNIAITSVIPVVSGGIGTGSLTAGTLLLADSATSFRVLSGSNSTPNYAVIWDTGSNSYIMGKGGIDVEPTQDGQVLISSGTKFVANRLAAGTNISIVHTAGTASISTQASIYGLAAGTNLVKGGSTNYPTMSLADQISLHAVTASHLFASTASIGILNYVNQNQLTIGDKYIVIMSGATDHTSLDESGIQWGSGSTAETVDEFGSNAHVRFISSSDSLEIWPRTTTPSLTASYISGGYIESTYFSGSFYGDGSGISGVVAESVADGTKYALTGSTNNFTGSQYISGGLVLTGSFQISGNIECQNTISASNYQGISTGSVDGLQQYIYNNITGSGSISVSSGTASLNANASVSILTASSHVSASTYYGNGSNLTDISVSTSGNISGSGTTANPIGLKDEISLSKVTASFFSGNGNNIIGIKADNIIDTLSVEHGGTGISTAPVSGSLLISNGSSWTTSLTASHALTASYVTSITSSNIVGSIPVTSGGTGLSSFTSGALYIASSTSSLTPFTASDFQMIAWDSGASRWQSYSQPYDIAAEISGSYASGSSVLTFKIPRNMTFTSTQESTPNFQYRVNNIVFIPSSNRTASAGDVLSVYATSASANEYFTILGSLR